MVPCILAHDLGTGGNKASLYDVDGHCLAASFVAYPTGYPAPGWHEQRPMDWWDAIVQSTRQLLAQVDVDPEEIACCGVSGHSLGVVPLNGSGRLLRESTPIWSDTRAHAQAQAFFKRVDEGQWYGITGNGFPAPMYSVFRIMWYRDNEPAWFRGIHKILGTKDFVNFKLTGRMVTDPSYASGSGVYNLSEWRYDDALMAAADLPGKILPDIVPSTEVIGELTADAAAALGLPRGVKVVAGGVDNACMALGAGNIEQGRVYNALGSSSWIAVSSGKPLLDQRARPYVFAHVIPEMFTSALSIFSAGSSFRWVRDQLCGNLVVQAEQQGVDPYDLMTTLAAEVPAGANGLLFNPSLAGGTLLDDRSDIRGAYVGLDLGHTQAHLIRAAMEGVAMGLRLALDALRKLTPLCDRMLVVGGGARSKLWRQILADVFGMDVVKTDVDQQASALGAATVAAVGVGLWDGFAKVDALHQVVDVTRCNGEDHAVYERLLPAYVRMGACQAEIAAILAGIPAE